VVILCIARFDINQQRQCTYNVTMRRVHHGTIVAVEATSIIYTCGCVCVGGEGVRACVRGRTGVGMYLRACSLTNPACKVPQYHLRPLWLHQIFRHYLINGMIF
jgi:hypothetical protein